MGKERERGDQCTWRISLIHYWIPPFGLAGWPMVVTLPMHSQGSFGTPGARNLNQKMETLTCDGSSAKQR